MQYFLMKIPSYLAGDSKIVKYMLQNLRIGENYATQVNMTASERVDDNIYLIAGDIFDWIKLFCRSVKI